MTTHQHGTFHCDDPACNLCIEDVDYEMSPAEEVPAGCEVRSYSSACCAHGTKGCIVVHAIDLGPTP